MGRKRNGLKWETDTYWQTGDYNSRFYLMLRQQVESLALTRYHWINLPETCNERYLEMTLFYQGMATIAKPRSGKGANKWLSLQMSGWENGIDIYGNPRIWRALAVNGYQFNVTPKNGYFVFDNCLQFPQFDRIDLWVRELVDIVKTMQQNRVHQKTPLLITGPQTKRLDMTNIVKQIGGGEVAIIASDGINEMQFKPLSQPNAVPFIGEELWGNYLNIWNQIYAGLGIGNLPFKAERRIEDEVESQSDPTDLIALDGLTCRRRLCDYLNANFPEFKEKPLQVVWRADNISKNYNTINNLQKLMKLGDNDDTVPTV